MRLGVAATIFALTLVLVNREVNAKTPVSQVIDNVFSGMDPFGKSILKKQLKDSPDEVSNAVINNFRQYRNEDYYKVSEGGKTAVTFSPSAGLNLNNGSLTAVYVRDGHIETHQYNIRSNRKPNEVEIPYSHDAYSGMKRDENFGFAMSAKKNENNERFEDVVSAIPVRRVFIADGNKISVRNFYSAIDVGGEPRRFTLSAELDSRPPEAKGKRVTGADGKEFFQSHPDSLSLSATVSRDTPTSQINKIDGIFKPRGSTNSYAFKYQLPPGKEGQQIQDIRFADNPRAREQTMEIVTTDAERLVYVVKVESGEVKLQPKPLRHDQIKVDMKEYRATIKRVEGRRVVDSETGQGGKGLEVESSAGSGTGK